MIDPDADLILISAKGILYYLKSQDLLVWADDLVEQSKKPGRSLI
jgi:hypothetical protein